MTIDQPRKSRARNSDDPRQLGFFTSERWGSIEARRATYSSGGACVGLIDADGAAIATLSVRLEGRAPTWPQFYAKTWSENAEIAQEALASGLFRDTGQRRATGFVEAQLWEYVDPAAGDLLKLR